MLQQNEVGSLPSRLHFVSVRAFTSHVPSQQGASVTSAKRFQEQRAKPHEFRTLQALRAYAALLIVAFHAGDASDRFFNRAPVESLHWNNGAVAVDMFFVISGFVMVIASRTMAARAGGWRSFLVRRLQRVVPLYWLATTLALAIVLLQPSYVSHGRPGLWHLVASYLFIPSRDQQGTILPLLAVGWSLNFEMFFYVLYAIALALRVNPLRVLLPVLLPLATLGLFSQPDWPAVTQLADSRVLEFCLGVAIAQWEGRDRWLGPRRSLALILVGAVLLTLLPQDAGLRGVIWGVPAAAVLLGCVTMERRLGPRLPRWLMEVGNASYAIYLIHPFIVPALARVLVAGRVPPLLTPALEIGGALMLSVVAGVLVHHQVERPILQWFRRRGAGGAPALAGRPAAADSGSSL
jgi:peptidoglycan/LPS O-acetylase OafA/YrhL